MNMTDKSDPRKGMATRNASNFLNSVNCCSEHFMLAIKRGSVSRIPNVDSQGSPTVKFKDYLSVYECDDASKTGPDQTFSRQTDGSGGSSIDCRVKLEMPSPEEGYYLGRSNSNIDVIDCESMLHKNDADTEIDYDDDELSGMTLRELKIKCKKQKMIKSFVSGMVDARSHAYGLECRTTKNAPLEPVDTESDLEEPLIILKEKLSKKNKPERKRKKCTHPSSPDSVISTQGINEPNLSPCLNAAQSDRGFISMDGGSLERAISMDSSVDFNLKIIKENVDSQTAVAGGECSAFSSLSEQKFPVCSVNRVSEEFQINETEANGSTSCSILDSCINDVLGFENCQVILETSENAVDTRCHALTSIQELDPRSVSSTEVSYSLKKGILEPYSLNKQQAVNIGNGVAYNTAKCHLPGQSMDEALDWHTRCELENTRPSPVADQSQCSSKEEASIERSLFNHQISLQESAEKNFGGVEISLSPLLCTFDPEPRTADHGSELFDSSTSSIRMAETMLESSDPMTEQCDDVACTGETCRKAENSVDHVNAFKGECEVDGDSTCKVAFRNAEVSSPGIEYADIIDSNGVSSKNSETSVRLAIRELVGEIPTDITVQYHSRRLKKDSNPEISTATCHSTDPNFLSSSTNCLNSIDACLDTTGEELISTVEEEMYSLKVREENTCSDVQGLEVIEGHIWFSRDRNQLSSVDEILLDDTSAEKIDEISTHLRGMLSNEGSNQSNEISSCQDVDGHKEDEALRYMLEHPPIKLLSNRKVLSPTSQEKLCQAVDAETDKVCRSEKKLLFEKRASNSSPPESGQGILERSSSPERIKFLGTGKRLLFEKRVNPTTSESSYSVRELMPSPERASKKSRNGSIPPATRGILKSSLSSMRPCSCTESSLTRKHTQEAITFSQRQMQDIESLATKLVKGLTSMKSIVEVSLNSEACLSEPSKYNAEELRIAIDNASELEDTTRRWLSMMGRDCNRFCKILKSTIHKTAAPVDGLRKDRKKITFADEAGGTLCHVKVFECQPSSLVDSAQGEVDPFPQTLVHQLGN